MRRLPLLWRVADDGLDSGSHSVQLRPGAALVPQHGKAGHGAMQHNLPGNLRDEILAQGDDLSNVPDDIDLGIHDQAIVEDEVNDDEVIELNREVPDPTAVISSSITPLEDVSPTIPSSEFQPGFTTQSTVTNATLTARVDSGTLQEPQSVA